MEWFLRPSDSKPWTSGHKPKRRRYDDRYLSLGFMWTGPADEPRPLSVICKDIVANDSMRPAKLRRHFETKHVEVAGKSPEFFQRKLQTIHGQKNFFEDFVKLNGKATVASYRVALRIAKAGKAHTIGDMLILPAAKDLCSVMLAASKINSVPLSDNTISRRISDMAHDCKGASVRQRQTQPIFCTPDRPIHRCGQLHSAVNICAVREKHGHSRRVSI